MGKYYLHDGQYLIATGECADGSEPLNVWGGFRMGLGDPPPSMAPKPSPAPQYDLARARAYPSLGNQFDALWHAMDDGLLPKIEPFYSDILTVKERFPKPSN